MKEDLVEQNIVGISFSVKIDSNNLIKYKEAFKKYSEELNFAFSMKKKRDNEGIMKYHLSLEEFVKPTEAREKIDLLVALFNNLFLIGTIDQEILKILNTSYLGVYLGKDIKELNSKIKGEDNYYVRHLGSRTLYIYAKLQDILDLEEDYDKLIQTIFGETPTEWYKRNLKILEKRFPNRKELESAKKIVEFFEKETNIEKIPHKHIRFRFSLE